SISAACCAPDNKHVALGSYDGTITIIDITQEDTKKQCQAQFEDYFLFFKDKTTKHPSIIARYQSNCKTPIKHIKYDENGIIFSRKRNIYRGNLLPQTSDIGQTLEVKKLLESTNPITAFDVIDGGKT